MIFLFSFGKRKKARILSNRKTNFFLQALFWGERSDDLHWIRDTQNQTLCKKKQTKNINLKFRIILFCLCCFVCVYGEFGSFWACWLWVGTKKSEFLREITVWSIAIVSVFVYFCVVFVFELKHEFCVLWSNVLISHSIGDHAYMRKSITTSIEFGNLTKHNKLTLPKLIITR